MSLADGEQFAGYVIRGRLGSGAMGEVYLAKHPNLPRVDALKILPTDVSADAELRERFNREADVASSLYHPHIVGVHDRGEHDDQLWISMDYVDGPDAARLLREGHPTGMPVAEALDIISAVGEALDYAHKKGLLHRDVKPGNILLTESGEVRRRILLADFGIARRLDDVSGLTQTNMAIGTVSYAAPEQLMGEELDGRADQYSLAATAFHLLTGSPPFPHANPAVVIGHHLNSPPPKLADSHPELAPLDDVLAVALAKAPDDRFPSCQDFTEALSSKLSLVQDTLVQDTFVQDTLVQHTLVQDTLVQDEDDAAVTLEATVVASNDVATQVAPVPAVTTVAATKPSSPPRAAKKETESTEVIATDAGDGQRLAGWAARACALLIDLVPGVAVLITLALLWLAVPLYGVSWWVYTVAAGLIVVGLAVNRWFLPSMTGWTLGRSVCAVRVVNRGGGSTSGLLRLLVRDVAHLLDTAALFIGWLWPLWDARRRTFADLLARTEVRSVEPPDYEPRRRAGAAFVVAMLLCAGLAGVGYLGIYRHDRAVDQARAQIADQGPHLVEQMLSYGVGTIKDDFTHAQSLVTDDYRPQLVAQQQAVEKVGATTNDYWAVSSAVLSADTDQASMLLAMQGQRGADAKNLKFITATLRVDFKRSGDGQWRIENLAVLKKPQAGSTGS